MKNAIILHGMPSKEEYYSPEYPSSSNFQWIPWLQKQLLIADIPAATPEMPHAYAPDYDVWKKEFERYDITTDTIIIGHSCGGGFLVRWLSENLNRHVGKVILVAPWLDPDSELKNDFFNFEIDQNISSHTKEIVLYSSSDDDEDIQASVRTIETEIPGVKHIRFTDRGHFLSKEFPELLTEII